MAHREAYGPRTREDSPGWMRRACRGEISHLDSACGGARQPVPVCGSSAQAPLRCWYLRLNLHADGQGYDLRLEDSTAKPLYAAFSDESGVIWQGEPLH